MRTGMQLTIQDYFEKAEIKRLGADQVHTGRKPPRADRGSFSKVFKTAQTSLEDRHHNLSIRDYFKNPIRVRRISRTTSAPKHQLVKSPRPMVRLDPPHHQPRPLSPSLASEKAAEATAPEKDKKIIQASIRKAARKYHLSPALLQAVIKAESNYRVRAVSPAGAQGLMQLMPGTAKELGVKDPFNIRQNIDGGARYLRNMLTRFNGDLEKALSAYNAGPGTVAKYNGHVPYPETRSYVARVLRYSEEFSDPTQRSS